MSSFDQATIHNQILRALPQNEWERLSPHLQFQAWPLGSTLQRENAPVTQAVFSEDALLSAILPSDHQVEVEIGIIGHEGQIGAEAILAGVPAITRTTVQVAGSGFLLPAAILRDEWAMGGAFQQLLLHQNTILGAQTARSALCNRLHTVEERLSRWLLLIQDSLQTDSFGISNPFIAAMLGMRVSGVPVALGLMQQAGIIRRIDNEIVILDRDQLKDSACDCYQILRERYDLWEQKIAAIQEHNQK